MTKASVYHELSEDKPEALEMDLPRAVGVGILKYFTIGVSVFMCDGA